MRRNATLFIFVGLLFLAPPYAVAGHGALLFRLGAFSPTGDSELWDHNVQTFDFDVADFNYVMGGIELDLQLKSYLDVAIGFDGYSRRVSSQYRDFIREDGTEIEQSFKLKVLPITGGLRFLPLRKFHKFIPHVATGVGLYYFDYQEDGEFIRAASITLIDTGTEVSRTSGITEDGLFSFDFVRAGSYELRVEALGYRPVLITSIEVGSGQLGGIQQARQEERRTASAGDVALEHGGQRTGFEGIGLTQLRTLPLARFEHSFADVI